PPGRLQPMDRRVPELDERSYWIPGSYVPTLSENRASFLRALKNKGFRGRENDKSRVVRHRYIHDPGIQQEPTIKDRINCFAWGVVVGLLFLTVGGIIARAIITAAAAESAGPGAAAIFLEGGT